MGEEHQEKGHGLCKPGNGPQPGYSDDQDHE